LAVGKLTEGITSTIKKVTTDLSKKYVK
jgi:hypothetical protein